MADLRWSPIQSQVPNYADAGNLAINTVLNLGNAFRDTGKNFSDMMSENAARSALQYLASSYDPNDMQSINKAMPLALMGNPNMSSDMLKQLTGEYRTTVNKQLDLDNLSIAKERAKEAQNLVDMALANADVNGTRAANKALNALNVRADARTFGDVDPLLNSQATRANLAADTALKKAAQNEMLRERQLSGLAYTFGEALAKAMPTDFDPNSIEDKRAMQEMLNALEGNAADIKGITKEDIYNARKKGEQVFNELRAAGVVPDTPFPRHGTLNASIINPTTLEETDLNWNYSLDPIFNIPLDTTQAIAQTANQIVDSSLPDSAKNGAPQNVIINAPSGRNAVNTSKVPSKQEREAMAADLEKSLLPDFTANWAMAGINNGVPNMGQFASQMANEDLKKTINDLRSNKPWEEIVGTSQNVSNLAKSTTNIDFQAKEQDRQKGLAIVNSVTALGNALQDNSLSPTKEVELKNAFDSLSVDYANVSADVHSYVAKDFHISVDSAHVPMVSDALADTVGAMYGIKPTTFTATSLGIKGSDGKTLTKEELLGMNSDDLFNAYANKRDWSDDEKSRAKEEYVKGTKKIYDRLNTKVDPTTAMSTASLLALTVVDAANEFNTSWLTKLGSKEDFKSNNTAKVFDKIDQELGKGTKSKMVKVLMTQREQKQNLDKISAAIQSVIVVNNKLMEIGKRVAKGKATVGDVARIKHLKETRDTAQSAGMTSLKQFTTNLAQKK